jgi:hypothetical protein
MNREYETARTDRIGRTRTNANDTISRLEHVAAAGDLERRVLIGRVTDGGNTNA